MKEDGRTRPERLSVVLFFYGPRQGRKVRGNHASVIETGPFRNCRLRLTDGLEHFPKACVSLMASPCFQFSVSLNAQDGSRQSRRHGDKRSKIFRGMPFHGKTCPQNHLVVPSGYENSHPVVLFPLVGLPPMLCDFLGGVRVSRRGE